MDHKQNHLKDLNQTKKNLPEEFYMYAEVVEKLEGNATKAI